MRLMLQLIARLLAIVLLCLAAAILWTMFDAYRSVDRATAASAQRVSQALEALYWRELLLHSSRTREQLLPVPEWRTIETMKLISPGVCVQLLPKAPFEKPLCGQSKGIGTPAPSWFAPLKSLLRGMPDCSAAAMNASHSGSGCLGFETDNGPPLPWNSSAPRSWSSASLKNGSTSS